MHTAPSGVPFDVTVTLISSTSFTLRWQPPSNGQLNGELTGFHVIVEELNTGISYTNFTSSPSILLDSLHPYYTYNCSVAAVTVSVGPLSKIVSIQTAQAGKHKCMYILIQL